MLVGILWNICSISLTACSISPTSLGGIPLNSTVKLHSEQAEKTNQRNNLVANLKFDPMFFSFGHFSWIRFNWYPAGFPPENPSTYFLWCGKFQFISAGSSWILMNKPMTLGDQTSNDKQGKHIRSNCFIGIIFKYFQLLK